MMSMRLLTTYVSITETRATLSRLAAADEEQASDKDELSIIEGKSETKHGIDGDCDLVTQGNAASFSGCISARCD